MAELHSLTVPNNAGQVRDEHRINAVFNWLPKEQFLRLMSTVYEVCKKENTPPLGEAFELDGVPFSTEADFAQCLAEETRELLYELATGEQRVLLNREAYGLAGEEA